MRAMLTGGVATRRNKPAAITSPDVRLAPRRRRTVERRRENLCMEIPPGPCRQNALPRKENNAVVLTFLRDNPGGIICHPEGEALAEVLVPDRRTLVRHE